LCLQDIDLETCREALDDCCLHQGDGQLELQEEEEDINQVNGGKKLKKGKQ